MKINGFTVIGIVFMGLGIFGVYNAAASFGKPDVDKRDVTTKGIITRVHGTTIKHRLTDVSMNSQFNFDYKFTAEDGKEYSNSTIINESQFHLLQEGQEITVRYHSHNPAVNASVPYGHYTSVGQMPKSTPLFRLLFSLGFCFCGGLILFLAFRDQQQSKATDPEFTG